LYNLNVEKEAKRFIRSQEIISHQMKSRRKESLKEVDKFIKQQLLLQLIQIKMKSLR
jgi:hypothetical protein